MSLMKFSVSLRVGQAEEHLIFWDFAAPRTHLLPGKVHAVQQDLDAEKGKTQAATVEIDLRRETVGPLDQP